MNTKRKNNQRGFTLVEVLIYTVLIMFILGGMLLAVYNIVEGSTALGQDVIIQEEANFLLRKIEWALSGASDINTPNSGNSGNVLSVDKDLNTIQFNLDSGNLRIDKGSGPIILNSEYVTVSSLSFEHIPASGTGPAAVRAEFYVDDKYFNLTKYLR
ncbi:MAG: type II secretion system protein [bacterium]|nr:type II secretion system protein [bacterium]